MGNKGNRDKMKREEQIFGMKWSHSPDMEHDIDHKKITKMWW